MRRTPLDLGDILLAGGDPPVRGTWRVLCSRPENLSRIVEFAISETTNEMSERIRYA
jgi:hypothetical protein